MLCNHFILLLLYTEVTKTKTKKDWTLFLGHLSNQYPRANQITLVMDNFSTHTAGALYEIFEPYQAKSLLNRFNFSYTPKHGSWLNMAEIELNILTGQCLNRRLSNIEAVTREVKAWEQARNNKNSKINWQFNIDHARFKLRRLYPTLES